MSQQCRCTHPIHTPTVVVGGRYVVGENPTNRWGSKIDPSWTGRLVGVTEGPDEDGDVLIDDAQWIDPRHLTPAPEACAHCQIHGGHDIDCQVVLDAVTAPEPAAAPAVDDDLLRAIHRAAGVGSAWSTNPEEWAARLLASEPMQRLRAAWTAEAERDRVAARDAATAQGIKLNAFLANVERERDEARTEAEHLRRAADDTWAEVERLRAAQQQMVDEAETHADGNVGDGCCELAERFARLVAADTSSDDEVRELGHRIIQTIREYEAEPFAVANVVSNLVETFNDAHRARGGQEADRA